MVKRWILTLVWLAAVALPTGAEPAAVGQAGPQGVTIVVNSFADDMNADGKCTLREALYAANTDQAVDGCQAGSGADLILLPAGIYPLALPGMHDLVGITGDLDIFESLTIRGAGMDLTILDGSKLDRVLDIAADSGKVQLEDLTVRNGGYTDEYQTSNIFSGTGIRNAADLSLLRVRVADNHYLDYQRLIVYGAGIYNQGKLSLHSAVVSGNRSDSVYGGGIYNTGELIVQDSEINNNSADSGQGAGIYNGGSAWIKNTVLSNDRLTGNSEYSNSGGCIYNAGEFYCENCTITDSFGYIGAIIYNQDEMALVDSTVGTAFNPYGHGALIETTGSLALLRTHVSEGNLRGIQGSGKLTLTNSTISAMEAVSGWSLPPGGGAIWFEGEVTLTGTVLTGNRAHGRGGAIVGSGQWTIENSAIVGNTAEPEFKYWDEEEGPGLGGGIFWTGGTLTVTNTTFSGNRAVDGGSAIYIEAGEVRLNSVTISANSFLQAHGRGALGLAGGTVLLRNSLLAGNPAGASPDCFQFQPTLSGSGPAASEIFSLGGNLVGVTSGCTLLPAAGDQLGSAPSPLDALLAPLADNNAAAPSHALLPGSPALDRIAATDCPATDQRGVTRPQGSACDVGAFELEQSVSRIQIWLPLLRRP